MAQAKRASSLCQDNLANDATACNIGNNQDDPSTTSPLHLLNDTSIQDIWQPVPMPQSQPSANHQMVITLQHNLHNSQTPRSISTKSICSSPCPVYGATLAFLATMKKWCTNLSQSPGCSESTGGSILLWMMFQTTRNSAWRATYAWHKPSDHFFPTIKGHNFQSTSISTALWNALSNQVWPIPLPEVIEHLAQQSLETHAKATSPPLAQPPVYLLSRKPQVDRNPTNPHQLTSKCQDQYHYCQGMVS